MGILKNSEVKELREMFTNNYSSIPFAPLMAWEFDTIVLNRQTGIVYYITRTDFNNCYKKQTKAEFEADIDELKKDGWTVALF